MDAYTVSFIIIYSIALVCVVSGGHSLFKKEKDHKVDYGLLIFGSATIIIDLITRISLQILL